MKQDIHGSSRWTRSGSCPIRIGFVGDLMLARGVDAAGDVKAPAAFWGDTLDVIQGADALVGNLESPITETDERWERCWKAFRFRARPHAVEILKAGNIKCVSLANNHILDCEVNGLTDTLGHLRAARIVHAGAGANAFDASRPAYFRARGIKVGVFSLTNTMPEFAAGRSSAGTNYVGIKTDRDTTSLLRRFHEEMRAAGAAITVLSVHWGPNLRPWPPARYRRFARAAIDLGFDVFHGHSAHLVQGIELRGHGIIFYDTGDLLDDYWVFPGIRTDRSVICFAEFTEGGFERVRVLPVSLRPTQVNIARGKEAEAIVHKILRLSRPFLTWEIPVSTALEIQCVHRLRSWSGEAVPPPRVASRERDGASSEVPA